MTSVKKRLPEAQIERERAKNLSAFVAAARSLALGRLLAGRPIGAKAKVSREGNVRWLDEWTESTGKKHSPLHRRLAERQQTALRGDERGISPALRVVLGEGQRKDKLRKVRPNAPRKGKFKVSDEDLRQAWQDVRAEASHSRVTLGTLESRYTRTQELLRERCRTSLSRTLRPLLGNYHVGDGSRSCRNAGRNAARWSAGKRTRLGGCLGSIVRVRGVRFAVDLGFAAG